MSSHSGDQGEDPCFHLPLLHGSSACSSTGDFKTSHSVVWTNQEHRWTHSLIFIIRWRSCSSQMSPMISSRESITDAFSLHVVSEAGAEVRASYQLYPHQNWVAYSHLNLMRGANQAVIGWWCGLEVGWQWWVGTVLIINNTNSSLSRCLSSIFPMDGVLGLLATLWLFTDVYVQLTSGW